MKKIKCIAIVAAALVVAMVVGIVVAVLIPESENSNSSDTKGELYVKELLDGYSIDKIIDDPDWQKDMIDATEDYVMVDAMRFDFSKQIGVKDGMSYLYYDHDSKEITMLMHNYVSYTNDLEPKHELENLVGNVQNKITSLLGNPSQPFMLMNTSGEFEDYSGLSVDNMIDKLIEGNTVMYTMYECNGLRYEMNVMFSDDTIYTMVWVTNEQADIASEDTEHTH